MDNEEEDDDEDAAPAALLANAKGDEDNEDSDGESSGEIARIIACDGDGVVRIDSDGRDGGGGGL